MGVDGRSGLLDSVPEGADEGAIGCHLLHDEPHGSVVVVDVQGGGECWHSQCTGSSCQSSQSRLSR